MLVVLALLAVVGELPALHSCTAMHVEPFLVSVSHMPCPRAVRCGHAQLLLTCCIFMQDLLYVSLNGCKLTASFRGMLPLQQLHVRLKKSSNRRELQSSRYVVSHMYSASINVELFFAAAGDDSVPAKVPVKVPAPKVEYVVVKSSPPPPPKAVYVKVEETSTPTPTPEVTIPVVVSGARLYPPPPEVCCCNCGSQMYMLTCGTRLLSEYG